MGGLPVIYLPDSKCSNDSLEVSGIELLGGIADACQVFSYIVDAQKSTSKEMNITIEHKDGSKTIKQFNQIETTAIKEYLSLFEIATMQPNWNISGALFFLSSMFYPTENLTYTDQLGYYRQREWRICSGHFKDGMQLEKLTNIEQQKELTNIDTEFFTRILNTRGRAETIAKRCRYINDFNGKRFLDLANRIVVQSDDVKKVKRILRSNKYKIDVVADIEHSGD